MDSFEEEIINLLKEATGIEEIKLEKPQDPKLGDYSFPTFPLAKIEKTNPKVIAEELSKKLKKTDNIKDIKATGGYINFFIKIIHVIFFFYKSTHHFYCFHNTKSFINQFIK